MDGPYETPEAGNPPVRVSYADPAALDIILENGWRWSMALPFVEVRRIPHALLLTVVALPGSICLIVGGFLLALKIRRFSKTSKSVENRGAAA